MLDKHMKKMIEKKKDEDKKIIHNEYDHRQNITTMLKVIHQCPMPDHLKRVMTTRIWGINPDVFFPLTHEQIAFINNGSNHQPTGPEINQIIEYENQGKFHCQQYMLSKSAQDIVNSFNKNEGKNKNSLFTNTTFEKKRFTVG